MDISIEDLVFLIRKAYPDIIPGQHFVCMQEVNDSSGERIGNAQISRWSYNEPEPDIATLYEQYESELIAERAGRMATEVRKLRDKLLRDTDWVVTRAIEIGSSVPVGMTTYRQALRDVPEQEGFPDNITWPESPQ